MRLRTQAGLLIAVALLIGAGVAIEAVRSIDVARRTAAAGGLAREVLREARGMLVLTHETARYGNERIAQQWHARHAALEARIAQALAAGPGDIPPPDVATSLAALPPMYRILVDTFSAPAGDAIALDRRELLVDELIGETQAVTEEVFRWGGLIEARRQESERRLALLVALSPALMALPLLAMGWLIVMRVLRPVGRLRVMMARVEAGDLTARLVATREDELGDLKRAFTRMTEALQASTARLSDNEQRLRLITDHLPARVSHYDLDDRCTFANQPFYQAWGYSGPSSVIGRTSAELLPAPLHAALKPYIAAARADAPQFFTVSVPAEGGRRYHEFAMVPDHDAEGRVQGLCVMARDVTERVEVESRIEAALREKEVLLKEVHHRVKNNMQIISSLLQLQSGAVESAPVRELLADSQDRIRSMALIHEKLYQHHDFARIDFADYLQGLLAVLSAAHGRAARIDIQAEQLWLGIDQAVPAGLIVNELVTNSWKHAFPGVRAGTIAVRLAAGEGRQVRLEVADDGIGLAPTTDPAHSRSLGLRLVRLLAEQLDAELRFGGPPGFSCTLVFEGQVAAHGAFHG